MSHSMVCSVHTPREKLLAKRGCVKSIEVISNVISMSHTLVSRGTDHRQDTFVQTGTEIQGGDNVVLLTTSHIVSFYSVKLRLDWSLKLSQLAGVTAEDTGILFSDRAGSDYNRFIYIPEKETRVWFFGQIEK